MGYRSRARVTLHPRNGLDQQQPVSDRCDTQGLQRIVGTKLSKLCPRNVLQWGTEDEYIGIACIGIHPEMSRMACARRLKVYVTYIIHIQSQL